MDKSKFASHKIKRVDRLDFGQSVDVLVGDQIGPVQLCEISFVIAAVDWEVMSPFFTPKELACKGTGLVYVHVPALKGYNTLRAEGFLRPHSPNSAYRSPPHNKAEGGGLESRHLAGAAYDIPRGAIKDVDAFLRRAVELGFNGFGFYKNFIHIDMRAEPATW